MSACHDCPAVTAKSQRARCCGETISQAAKRITAMGMDAPPIGGWAPGFYQCMCVCGSEFTGDKRAVTCLPCAIRGAENPGTISDEDATRLQQLFKKQASEPEPRPSLDTTPQRPRIGQRVTVGDRVGVVCAPNDPRRTGTYKSDTHGDIPIALHRNRAERRRAMREAKRSRGR